LHQVGISLYFKGSLFVLSQKTIRDTPKNLAHCGSAKARNFIQETVN